MATKLVYDHGHVLIETTENHISYQNSGTTLLITFAFDEWFYLKNVIGERENQANISFVAEGMRMSNGSRYPIYSFDCVAATDPSLRYLVIDGRLTNCYGPTRLRNLTEEEQNQMKKFKNNSDGKSVSPIRLPSVVCLQGECLILLQQFNQFLLTK